MPIIQAFNTRTRKSVEVPDHWIGDPRLGVDLTLDAPTSPPESSGAKKARTRAAETPASGDEKE